ncbi:MAG: hypothetical protein IT559_02050 [Alphaproteobacteria bacterium]|nr:hypothetical protein [Alphaproteobacteria bacterium]
MINSINSALTGIATATQKLDATASRIAAPQGGETLVEDIVDLRVSETQFRANIKVIQTVSDLTQELLNAFDKKV